jgi:hypothetical protein
MMVAGIPWDEIHPDAWPAPRPPKQARRRRFLGRRKQELAAEPAAVEREDNGSTGSGEPCSAGADGPFQCELMEGHEGSHVSTFKWDSDMIVTQK